MRQLRMLLADDQPRILDLLQMLPQPDCDVVGAVKDDQTLVRAAQALKPDVVVADIDRPKLGAIETTRQLSMAMLDCRVILMSAHGKPEIMDSAMQLVPLLIS